MSNQKELITSLQDSVVKLRAMLDLIPDTIFCISKDYIYVNYKPGEDFKPYLPAEKLLNKSVDEVLPPKLAFQLKEAIDHSLQNNAMVITEFMLPKGKDKEIYYYEGRCIPAGSNEVQVINRDITHQKRLENNLRYLTTRDALTELPNRYSFIRSIEKALERKTQSMFAVLLIDIDGFKIFNDGLGLSLSDQLLKSVSDRLQTFKTKTNIISRFGGDEFALLIQNLSGINSLINMLEKFQKRLAEPFQISNYQVNLNVSIGAVLSAPENYENAEDMLRDASIGLRQAKSTGKAKYCILESSAYANYTQRLLLENDLRKILTDRDNTKELQLYYQPIIDLSSGRITSFEALLRWQHSEKGWIPPEKIVSIAEESGLIIPLGWWIVQAACSQIYTWKQNLVNKNFRMAVNISVLQLVQTDFLDHFNHTLERANVNPSDLCFEITESAFLEPKTIKEENLAELKIKGLQLSMDDFGKGYSSLSRITSIPIDSVKIDRSFIWAMENSSDSSTLVDMMVAMVHTLGLNIVAEGIETKSQLEKLLQLECQKGQGYLFSKPLSAKEATTLLKNGYCYY